jgi:arylsulfatase A-like enzyme
MTRRFLVHTLFASALAVAGTQLPAEVGGSSARAEAGPIKPNIVYVLADDLGYGDLGSYGQRTIRTPHLDRMAAEGTRFSEHYGASVCAPSRYTLLTGLRSGSGHVRGLSPHVDLPTNHPGVARTLKSAGYRTALIGKWGLGDPGTSGVPRLQGFDTFYGYLTHVEAHNYFPPYLWRREPTWTSERKETLPKGTYAGDRLTAEAKAFITRNRTAPFYLHLAYTNPHAGTNGRLAPTTAPYTNMPWPEAEKQKAAAITLLDRYVGTLLAHLRSLDLDSRTVVFFSSDNGPHEEGGVNPEFFDSNGRLRGIKRSLFEGGIRVPLIVRSPGRVRPGVVIDEYYANWDLMKTVAAFAGVSAPKGTDGQSMLPALTASPPPSRPNLYFEYHLGGRRRQALRVGGWKVIRLGPDSPAALYNLEVDPGETTDLASVEPARLASMLATMDARHEPHPLWP